MAGLLSMATGLVVMLPATTGKGRTHGFKRDPGATIREVVLERAGGGTSTEPLIRIWIRFFMA